MKMLWLLSLIFVTLFTACNSSPPEEKASQLTSQPSSPERPKIVAFGDSLTAGLGLDASETYPAQLQKMLNQAGYKYEVVNAGVSGDTTSGGLRRVDWIMDGDVKYVILELGANDILRGQPVSLIKENLTQIIRKMQGAGATVILTGMEAPTNSGPEYREEVHRAYQQLADEHNLPFIPFILKGVAGSETLNQEDLSHPNSQGAFVLAQNVFETLKPLLDEAKLKQ